MKTGFTAENAEDAERMALNRKGAKDAKKTIETFAFFAPSRFHWLCALCVLYGE
jgi:hypothetical protein